MEKKRSLFMSLLPWLLMAIGFLTLNMFQGFVAMPCLVVGIVMLIEKRWPEKWGDESA